jgi:hypothetical protein
MSSIKGDISVMSFADLLQWIEICGKTGTIMLRNPGIEKKIYMEEGKIVFVSSTKEGERLGEYLQKGSHLDLGKIKAALIQAQNMKISFTQKLLKLNYFSSMELRNIIGIHAQELLLDPLRWTEGTFEFSDSELPPDVLGGPIKLNTYQLVSRIFSRLEETGAELSRKNIQYCFINRQK